MSLARRTGEVVSNGAGATVDVALNESKHEMAKVMLGESRDELTRADGKASLLLAALGIGTSAILAAILAGTWTPFALREPYQALWWAGTFAAGVCFFSLCAAVWLEGGDLLRRRSSA